MTTIHHNKLFLAEPPDQALGQQASENTEETMPAPGPQINSARLRELLDGVNRFGFNRDTGGFNRTGYSDADMAVRAWFEDQMRADGLVVRRDGVANLHSELRRHQPLAGRMVGLGGYRARSESAPRSGGKARRGPPGACIAVMPIECRACLGGRQLRASSPSRPDINLAGDAGHLKIVDQDIDAEGPSSG
jgi:hypothetical protein